MGATSKDTMGACGGQKEKPEAAEGEAPAPGGAPTTAAAAKPAREDKSLDYLSPDLKTLMQDYFNRYDLDGSQTINSSEELKQLCTNLVVKLDLPMDVSDIDAVVGAVGAFEDDPVDSPPKGQRNEWNLDAFVAWFCQKGHFDVDRNWQTGDLSDEDEEPTAARPFLTGTYLGELSGGGKKYTIKQMVGGKVDNKTKKMVGAKLEESPTFMFKLRPDKDDEKKLKDRKGCDSVGYFNTSGSIDGDSIQIIMEYDIDGNSATKEPKLVLDGKWAGEGDKYKIVGTWKNANVDDAKAAEAMKWIGLDGVQEGEFFLEKRIRVE